MLQCIDFTEELEYPTEYVELEVVLLFFTYPFLLYLYIYIYKLNLDAPELSYMTSLRGNRVVISRPVQILSDNR